MTRKDFETIISDLCQQRDYMKEYSRHPGLRGKPASHLRREKRRVKQLIDDFNRAIDALDDIRRQY